MKTDKPQSRPLSGIARDAGSYGGAILTAGARTAGDASRRSP
jgi:hypothetical protein